MLDLFLSDFDRDALAGRIAELVKRNVYVGTSSWKYSGWLGMLYDRTRYETKGKFSLARFEDECLAEYCQFLSTVCVDAGYYKFPDLAYLDRLFRDVPSYCRLSFKVTDIITLRRFPALARYGAEQGKLNPLFLSSNLFLESFFMPLQEFRARIGVLIFEFAEFRASDLEPESFLERLERFLGALPSDWQYGVELRSRSFVTPDYFRLLSKFRVAHVFNQWNRMPSVKRQLQWPGSVTTDFTVGRFLLRPGKSYQEAVERFSPYQETREIDPSARNAARKLIWDVPMKEGRPTFVYINNRLEGNALNTIWAVTSRDQD
ncbi:MAG: DUF72 domain-containing protein [Verrucomicrobia bacterium]|nr:DUF72 domain-containing protein [Verrucomicrobiota bacterium]